MAKVGILEENQPDSGEPRTHRKRVIVAYLVRCGVLEWVIKNQLARKISKHEFRARRLAACVLKDPWESPELPGLTFEPPNIKHNPEAAMVRFFPRSKCLKTAI